MQEAIKELRKTILNNLSYLSDEYELTHSILEELESMINYNMGSGIIIQWWINNEYSINEINKLIEEIGD